MLSVVGARKSLVMVIFASLLAIVAGMHPASAARYADIIVDAKTGKVISSNSPDALRSPASLTKMMTLYLTFEAIRDGRLRWDQRIKMSQNGARTIPTKLGIRAGNTFTVREAVNGMIIRSANDVAEAMGDHLAGSEAKFGQMATRKARRLGMSRTVFRNASGLPARGQVTTARDMSKLAIALQRDFPNEYKLFSRSNFAFRGKRIRGHNNLMYRYKGMDGIKTGYTNASGFNIASSVKQNGRHVVGVVLGGRTARSRDNQMATLMNTAMRRATTRGTPVVAQAKPSAGRNVERQVAEIDVETKPLPGKRPRSKDRDRTVDQVIAQAESGLAKESRKSAKAKTSRQATGRFEIQIAATDTRSQANALLSRANRAIDGDYPGLGTRTETVERGSKTLHRARLTGFEDRQMAAAACSALKARKFDCMVVN